MTPLTIIPNYEKKRLKCYGTVAAGEHVLVTVTGGNDWVAPDGENQTLRLRLLFGPHTVGVFPFVTEKMHEDDPDTFPTVDAWDTNGDDPTCDLNLNTIQAAKFLKFGGNCLFVLDDPKNDILYATGEFEVLPWPKRRGADLPYDLDGYPDFVFTARKAMEDAAADAQSAAENAATAVETVNAALETADNFVNRAETAATNAQTSASSAQDSATEAKGWANGGTDGDTPTATNNAKYYAGQAGDAKTDAAASATAAANSATAASGSATSAAASAQSAAGAAEAAVEMEKERAEGAESDLADAIDAEKERAEGAEALAIVNAEYNGTSQRIVFTTGGGDTITIDASAFIKDGMISSVAISNGNLVITFNSDAGKQPISIPLTQIFNPSNYYDKTAADGTFVKKDGEKVLSTNDYTTAEKQKLAGIAAGANAYVLPIATASTLGGVKQGTGCEIAADGTLNVTGGSGGTVDDTVTRTSANPVRSSGIWGAIWGALTALPTGFASLYDWCVAQLAGKLSTSGGLMTGAINFYSDGLDRGLIGGEGYTDPNTNKTVSWPSEVLQDDKFAMASQIPDISGKASAADLRYRIAEAAVRKTLPADCFPVTFTYEGVSYSINALVNESDASAAGDMFIVANENDYTLVMVESPATGSEKANYVEVATFSAGGVFETSGIQDLQFGGVSPVADTSPTLADIKILADRTVNLITADDETSIDIELPDAVLVDGVRYCRDFLLDIDNSANANDLALEFTGLGVTYGFVTDADDDISEMMTIVGYGTGSSGDGERVRLYFTECAVTGGTGMPLFHVARVTLGDFVTSTTTTQGGN